MIKKLFFYMILAVSITACNSANTTTDVEGNAEETALSVDDLLAQIDTLVGQEVIVMGHVDHVCKHGGTKMVIYTNDPENGLHIDATEESGNFRADEVMDEMVRVVGIVDEFIVDDGYIAEKEAQLEEMKANAGEGEEDCGKCGDEKGDGKDCDDKEGEHHDKGNFPDNDNKHKQEVSGLENQINGLKAQLAEARAAGKEHLSFYSVKCVSYTILEHEHNDEVKVESKGHVESAIEEEATAE